MVAAIPSRTRGILATSQISPIDAAISMNRASSYIGEVEAAMYWSGSDAQGRNPDHTEEKLLRAIFGRRRPR